jgi:hypothetical protein
MNIWHDITKEIPPIGECVCILWNDGLITTDIWDKSDIVDTKFQKYWSFSKELLPIEFKKS